MATLKLEIVTPEAISYSDEVDMVEIPGKDGDLGILPDHIPLMTLLRPGELKAMKSGKEIVLAVGTGIAEVFENRVSILTDMAMSETDINEAEAEAAMEKAKAALNDASLEGDELVAMEAMLQKSMAMLALKRKKRSI